MAGDWIPYDIALPTKREVRLIGKATGISRFEVMGRLLAFWGWASLETSNGVLRGLDLSDLVDLVGFDLEFWNAVVEVQWIKVRRDGLFLPNAERWITRGAKARLQKNRRQAKWRDADVDAEVSTSRDVDVDAPGDAIVDATCVPKASTTEQNSTEKKEKDSSLRSVPGSKRETWVTPYVDTWADVFGVQPKVGLLVGTLREADRQSENGELSTALRNYLEAHRGEKSRYLDLPKFAASWREWLRVVIKPDAAGVVSW
jgi:hypothetical protein